MTPAKIIEKKKNGLKLSKDEIKYFIGGFIDGNIPDYQMSALLMAICLRGMDVGETVNLTEIMLESGDKVDFSGVPGKRVDKHSTGGVGDKLSLMIAPTVAACGGMIPMISGRGLGHTGGTLDKLESIPGFNIKMSAEDIKNQTVKIGAALAGQDERLVPADKKIYALRDVTATVQSIPLITSSIISKKAAEGIDVLILDVKTGGGGFFPQFSDMELLAKSLVKVGSEFGMETIAILTSMEQPLGYAVGNWLEVAECLEIMKGDDLIFDVKTLNAAFSGTMLAKSGLADSINDGITKAEKAVSEGKSFDKFLSIVEHQHGDTRVLREPENYPKSAYHSDYKVDVDGFISKIDAKAVGEMAIILGAGRQKVDDKIDYKAGIVFQKKCGDRVDSGEIVANIFSDDKNAVEIVRERMKNIIIADKVPPAFNPLICKVICEDGEYSWDDYID